MYPVTPSFSTPKFKGLTQRIQTELHAPKKAVEETKDPGLDATEKQMIEKVLNGLQNPVDAARWVLPYLIKKPSGPDSPWFETKLAEKIEQIIQLYGTPNLSHLGKREGESVAIHLRKAGTSFIRELTGKIKDSAYTPTENGPVEAVLIKAIKEFGIRQEPVKELSNLSLFFHWLFHCRV